MWNVCTGFGRKWAGKSSSGWMPIRVTRRINSKIFLQQTASLELEFIEQPLASRRFEGMRRLPEAVRKKVAADESLLDARDALACLEPPRPFGIFNIKLMKCGGIAPGLQIAVDRPTCGNRSDVGMYG